MSGNKDVKASLLAYLKELHLPAMRASFEEQARQAQKETLSYEQYLLELSRQECETRRAHRIERLLRQSRLAREKDLPGFDLKDRKSTRLNSSHIQKSRMPSSA